MNDEELKYLGRIHTAKQFLDNYQAARKAGFENINIDLMSALPGQTTDSWLDTLNKAAAFEIEHLSAYSLIIEGRNTVLGIFMVTIGAAKRMWRALLLTVEPVSRRKQQYRHCRIKTAERLTAD